MRSFRAGALALPVSVLPLAVGWALGGYGSPPPGVSTAALGAHWIMAWLAPVCVAMVMSYGSAHAGVDHRLASVADVRGRWWRDQAVPLLGCLTAVASAAYGLGGVSGEPFPSLFLPALNGGVFAVCAANVVVTRFAPAPSAAMAVTTGITGAVVAVPYLLPEAAFLGVDATLTGWTHDRAVVPMVWAAAGVASAVLARFRPADCAHLSWISREAANDDRIA
uniref:hypothetical protein n=1 Tax=Herbidospora sakaeratensis TaxID=564415 RepID=UPI0007832455|nr:hypothetical protein [Herbidospora sakaeratensis]